MERKTEKMTVAEQVESIVQESVQKLAELAKKQRMDMGFILWLGSQEMKRKVIEKKVKANGKTDKA